MLKVGTATVANSSEPLHTNMHSEFMLHEFECRKRKSALFRFNKYITVVYNNMVTY